MLNNFIIGKNNTIEDGVIIENGVIIGDNNTIKKGTHIYRNTVIGNDNYIMENNMLGTLAVDADHTYTVTRKGLIIGDNNFFHINNTISSGWYNKTTIGNDNKFLSYVYISHDNVIHDNVTFYPKVFSAGLATFFDYSNMGAGAHIQQRTKVGAYSMIGMNGVATRNVLPFMICINNRYIRLNLKRIENIRFKNEKEKTNFLVILSDMSDVLKEIPINNEDSVQIIDIFRNKMPQKLMKYFDEMK